MNSAHIHLVLNHFPVIGVIFSIVLLGFGLLRKSGEIVKTGLVILVFAGVAAIPVYLTGEPAEEIVEKLSGVSEAIIEQHESYAKFALGAAILTGLTALSSLIAGRFAEKASTRLVIGTFFLSLITGGVMLKTANLGGQIRHSEIRDNSVVTTEPQTTNEKEKDDDDH